ncbi:pre-mRNA cleavage complex 2 protein Pcf11 isoform X2 [Chanos chanos]|uniref:Pre-mRNA cleavage complex 2 protein Pcf11 n=1 Tax=Chanos chanos TaxID=29144 RepID=A0A6J2VUX3_CHACN|nr:pre-mRNA cleavage complex 2 protein Pcf11 isoform X2 [Chanos chanos]
MSDEAAREDACREYQSSLEDLTFNSKPHINMLTILAEENLHFAKDIVAIIEAQIIKAPPAEKLPVLYLVDSIVKNVGGEYLDVFAKNLVTSFICVFEKVDENTRKSLFKLRSTWDDIFPLKKLYSLDVRVNSLDPAWPIKPLPPNVNASIHVNPKFLKQTEEVTPPRSSAPQPQALPSVSERNMTQEQIIRQQLLAKQKQLLELQQKKIELELEQTKAQLAANPLVATNPPSVTAAVHFEMHAGNQSGPTPPTKSWPPQQSDKPPTRDPRLNRMGSAVSHAKETVLAVKETQYTAGAMAMLDKRVQPSVDRQNKLRIPKKESVSEEKPKSKSASLLNRSTSGKSRASEPENIKAPEVNKKDPRLRKQIHEKTDSKDEEIKEKKRGSDKKERDDQVKSSEQQKSTNIRGKLANGSVNMHEDTKVNKNNLRKRSRSRSRSPSLHSPKRKDRRSPKGRTRSISPTSKSGKGRQISSKHSHTEDPVQHVIVREERSTPKKNTAEPRRPKRSLEDRTPEPRDGLRPSSVESKESKDVKRWRSGWEEIKHPKQLEPEPSHGKLGPQRHKAWASGQRPATPRMLKQPRLSVDANLQIPDVLNSASKRDLLKRASKRHEDGEISHEDFLNVAHQIRQLFQYQEEKQRSDSLDGSSDDGSLTVKKKTTPQHGKMSDAELSYLEHKSKLKRTQLQRPVLKGRQSPSSEKVAQQRTEHEEGEPSQGAADVQNRCGRVTDGLNPSDTLKPFSGHEAPRKNDRPPHFRNSPSPVHPEGRFTKSPTATFDRPSSPADMDLGLHPDGDISPKFESPNSEHSDMGLDNDVSVPLEPPARYDMFSGPDRGSLVSRMPCDSPGKTPPQPSEGPITQPNMAGYDDPNISQRFEGHKSSQPLFEEPSALVGQLRPDRPHLQSRYEGNTGPGRYDGSAGMHGHSRYDAAHGPSRFERPPLLKGPERFVRPDRYDDSPMPRGPMRYSGPRGMGRFGGPHSQQGSGRYDPSLGHQGSGRFDGQGSAHFDGPVQPHRYDVPTRFDNPHVPQGPPGGYDVPMRFSSGPINYEGPHGQGPVRFDSPSSQVDSMRFESPGQPIQPSMRYGRQVPGMSRYDCAVQPGPPRYGPPNMQNPMRPQVQGMYDPLPGQGPLTNPTGPVQSNFNMPNRFPDTVNSFGGPPQQFHGQQSVSQASNFNMPASGFPNSYRSVGPFPGAPMGNMTQPVNVISSHGQAFVPQNPVSFTQPASQFAQPESHLGQMDVNDLLSKLISTGIIKLPHTDLATAESTSALQSQTTADEEDEEEQDDEENVPDLTGFVIDDMKQRYDNVVTKLYTGIQCYSCGMRFTASQTDVYADHLDWHYRQNRSEKDISKKVTHRRWYYSLTDWIEFEEIADLEERAKSQFFEKVHEEVVQKTQEAAKEKEFQSVRAAPDVVDESCEICQEQFETYWEEEEEEWHLKNAIRVDGKTYHPSCYEDYKNTSSFVDCTPSPNKMLTENPLNVFLKQEPGEENSLSSIKEEPATESTESVPVKEEVQVKLEEDSQSSAIIF